MWSTKRKGSSDDNMIPLINIVFLLLIFFMVAGQIQKRPDDTIDIPTLNLTESLAPPIQNMVEIFADGQIAVNQRITTTDELTEKLSRLRGAITLVADRSTTAADLEKILAVLRPPEKSQPQNNAKGISASNNGISVNLLLEAGNE